MSGILARVLLMVALLALLTCSSHSASEPPTPEPSSKQRVGQTRGSAVALSRDERIAVVCNRTASVVTVFSVDFGAATADELITPKKQIDLGPDWEPWAAVIGADDDTAYVISRSKHVVFRILGLHANPIRDDVLRDVQVGSEPTGIVITPSGARLFVANFGEGTISVVTTFDFQPRGSLDLNDALAKTGVLGQNVRGHAALAHPRALAITDSGDAEDSDETLYATEFFSQPSPAPVSTTTGPTTTGTIGTTDAGGGWGGGPEPPLPASELCTGWVAPIADAGHRCEWECLCETCAVHVNFCHGDPKCIPVLACMFETHCGDAGIDTPLCPLCRANEAGMTYLGGPRVPSIFDSCVPDCVKQCSNGRVSEAGIDVDFDASATADAFRDAATAESNSRDVAPRDSDLPPSDASTERDGASPPPDASLSGGNLGDVTRFDSNRHGLVYPIKLSAGEVGTPIRIGPVPTGYLGSTCFPNQLYAAAARGGRLFVTSMCASPAGPLGSADPANFKTVVHPTVFVVDTNVGGPVHVDDVVLTRQLEAAYDQDEASGLGAAQRRFPLIPGDVAIGPGVTTPPGVEPRSRVWLTALGADAVFNVDVGPGPFPALRIGSPGRRFVDLHPRKLDSGQLPVGIVLSQRSGTPFALVVNDASQNLSAIDLSTETVVAVVPTAETIPRARDWLEWSANRGHRLFATGLDAWSLKGEAWLSCESCHPDGQSDGITWFFPRGPRRTISTANTYDNEAREPFAIHRRVMLWTGNVDEVHDVEGIVRGVAGGMGALLWTYPLGTPTNDFRIVYDGSTVPTGAKFNPKPTTFLHNNLNGSTASLVTRDFCRPDAPQCDSTAIRDWNDIDAYIRTVRAPRAPTYLDRAEIEAGEALFRQGKCAGCHGGPTFTLSRVFYDPGPQNNGALPYTRPTKADPFELFVLRGQLRFDTYRVPEPLRRLNVPGASGSAPLRAYNPGAVDPVQYLYDPATALADQINCVLRSVGTFPDPPSVEGIVPPGAPSVLEVRHDMKTRALGDTGFNIPSLIGLGTGAPYFHAGNARTLEEVFDPVFSKHHQALNSDFLADPSKREEQIAALVTYLLSIDDSSRAPADPGLPFVPDLCERAVAEP